LRIDIGKSGTSLKLSGSDCVFVGLDGDAWLPAQVGVRLFGDRMAIKVDFDLRDLYRGSDGAFYVVHGLGADEVTFDGLVLKRVKNIRDLEPE